MISIELIRDNPDEVRRALGKRVQHVPIDRILDLDARRRGLIAEADGLRARRNEVSRQLGRTEDRPPELIEEMRQVGARIKDLEVEARSVEEELGPLLLELPNIPDEDVPVGADESGNVVLRTAGELPSFSFEPLPHWELGERLDIIDLRRGAKLSGSRFYVLKGKGARLQRALISWMLDLHVEEHGYQELYLPDLVSRETATGSGQLPKFADTMYHDEKDDLWMVPTAEVPLTGLHADEILPPGQLPISYVAHTRASGEKRLPLVGTPEGSSGYTSSRRSSCTSSSSRQTPAPRSTALSAKPKPSASGWGFLTGCCSYAPESSALPPSRRSTSRCGPPVATSGWR